MKDMKFGVGITFNKDLLMKDLRQFLLDHDDKSEVEAFKIFIEIFRISFNKYIDIRQLQKGDLKK